MKKKALLLPIATMALLGATAATAPAPTEAKAEEPASSEVSESRTWEEIQDVKVEGKSIKEWIEGIKNEETRRSTLIALIVAVGGAALLLIKWLTERNIVKKSLAQTIDNAVRIGKMEELCAKLEAILDEGKESVAGQLSDAKEQFGITAEELKAILESDTKERECIRKALLQMSQDSKDFVAAGTYKKIRSYLEVKEDGEGE